MYREKIISYSGPVSRGQSYNVLTGEVQHEWVMTFQFITPVGERLNFEIAITDGAGSRYIPNSTVAELLDLARLEMDRVRKILTKTFYGRSNLKYRPEFWDEKKPKLYLKLCDKDD